MSRVQFYLEIASWFAGLIKVSVEYVKRNEWPSRSVDNSDSGSSDVDLHAEGEKEVEAEPFVPSEGESKPATNKSVNPKPSNKP